MDVAFKAFPEYQVLIESFSGRLTREDLWVAIQASWEAPGYDPSFSGMSDLRRAQIAMSVEEFRLLEGDLFNHPMKAKGQWFWLSDAPLATAYGLLHEKATQHRSPFIVTSTWEAGWNWMEKNIPYALLEEVNAARRPLLEL